MHPDSNARREALRLVRRGAAASLLGGLAYAGWQAARALPPTEYLGYRLGQLLPRRAAEFEWRAERPEPVLRDLDGEVRALTDALLSQTEDYGALALRAQLTRAHTLDLVPTVGEDDFAPPTDFATFEVPEDVPLAVPADAEFPVRARFVGPDGAAYVVSLRIDEGRLGYLQLLRLEEYGDVEVPVTAWPDPGEVTFWIDTIKGPEPVLR